MTEEELACLKWMQAGDVPLRVDMAFEAGYRAAKFAAHAMPEMCVDEYQPWGSDEAEDMAQQNYKEMSEQQEFRDVLDVKSLLVTAYHRGLNNGFFETRDRLKLRSVSEVREAYAKEVKLNADERSYLRSVIERDAERARSEKLVESMHKSMGEMGTSSLSYHILKNALAAYEAGRDQG